MLAGEEGDAAGRRGCSAARSKSQAASRASVAMRPLRDVRSRPAPCGCRGASRGAGRRRRRCAGRRARCRRRWRRGRRAAARRPVPSNRSAMRPLRDVEHVQVRHAAHRQVVVPEAVLRLAGDVAALLALLEFLQPLRLRLGALQLGPDPGDEGDALAVGEPLEGLDAGREVADAPRLAAVGRDQVELRRVVLRALPARAWRRRRSRRPRATTRAGRPSRRSA